MFGRAKPEVMRPSNKSSGGRKADELPTIERYIFRSRCKPEVVHSHLQSDLEENSQATKSFEDLYDGQISVEVSRQSNLGIADMIYKQLSEQNKK